MLEAGIPNADHVGHVAVDFRMLAEREALDLVLRCEVGHHLGAEMPIHLADLSAIRQAAVGVVRLPCLSACREVRADEACCRPAEVFDGRAWLRSWRWCRGWRWRR